MVRRFKRQEVVTRLKAEIDEGRALFDAFVGTGISAKFAEAGGADMITTHILARFRTAGLSSMAGHLSIADANGVTLELGKRDIISIVKNTPVMAGDFSERIQPETWSPFSMRLSQQAFRGCSIAPRLPSSMGISGEPWRKLD